MRHTILIIDDDSLILNTLKDRFGAMQGEVYAVKTTDEAKEILERVKPDAVLTDLLLTKDTGASDLIDYMKTKDSLAHVPVIIFTNMDTPDLRQVMMEKGVKEYLIKGSFKLDDLYEKVMGYLEPNE